MRIFGAARAELETRQARALTDSPPATSRLQRTFDCAAFLRFWMAFARAMAMARPVPSRSMLAGSGFWGRADVDVRSSLMPLL